ncbi:unnamed protein product [Phytophthora lilii]|uniref:Unnamed protein product n=1 Tax=Phytophthora lilii TaxID=2077276 RepID=A0A9W6XFK6_9STRA|nr:unnamed protein product [Phytophthora lilii]
MDTDSAYIAFSCEKPFEECIKPELLDHFKDHKYDWFPRDDTSKNVAYDRRTPGLFKEEFRCNAMVSFSSKNDCCYLGDEIDKETKLPKVKVSAKGVQKSLNQGALSPDNFENVVKTRNSIEGTNKGFRICSETKSTITYRQQKTALNYFYDKRKVLRMV